MSFEYVDWRARWTKDEMGAGKVCVEFAGTKYGGSFLQRPWDSYDRGKGNVGKVLAGCKARICKIDPKGRLPHRDYGEFHNGGPFLTQEYLLHPSLSQRQMDNFMMTRKDTG
jgi:hypothetical protein